MKTGGNIMPIPLILAGAAALAGVAGLAKGGKAISNNSKAKDLIDDAQYKYDCAKEQLEEQRELTSSDLDQLGRTKLESWSNDIGNFIELFKQFKNVELQGNVNLNDSLRMQMDNPANFKKMEVAALKAGEVMKTGVSSLGAGALAGIASYGGAMMFASASTGTAIASLSGVAATNATLAWFGGGSLAAGGLGMAGGTAVLGGIVAGPVLAVAGFIMAAKSEENLANARKVCSEAKLAVEKMNTMTDFMDKLSAISNDYNSFILKLSKHYQLFIQRLDNIYNDAMEKQKKYFVNKVRKTFGLRVKIDFTKLNLQEQKTLQASWLLTQVLYAILTAPILTNDGEIDAKAYNTISDARETTQNLIGVFE